jgi:hypothetical protein
VNISDAQRDVRSVFLGGFPGQLVSSLVCLLSAVLATWLSPKSAIIALFVGGFFIFPLTSGLVLPRLHDCARHTLFAFHLLVRHAAVWCSGSIADWSRPNHRPVHTVCVQPGCLADGGGSASFCLRLPKCYPKGEQTGSADSLGYLHTKLPSQSRPRAPCLAMSVNRPFRTELVFSVVDRNGRSENCSRYDSVRSV